MSITGARPFLLGLSLIFAATHPSRPGGAGRAHSAARSPKQCRRSFRPCRRCWPWPPPSSRGRSRAARSSSFDEIVTRLEVPPPPGDADRPRPRAAGPGLRAAGARVLQHRPAGQGGRQLPLPGAAQPAVFDEQGKVSPKVVDYFNSVKKALVGYLAVSSTPPGGQGQPERRVPEPHRLLPPRGPGRRIHGRDQPRRLSHGDAAAEHRPQGDGDPPGRADAHAGQRVLGDGAGRSRGLARRPAPRHDRRGPGPELLDAACARRASIRRGPRPAWSWRTSPWAPHPGAAPEVLRAGQAHAGDAGGARLRDGAHQARRLGGLAAAPLRSAGGAHLPRRRSDGHHAQGARRRLLRQPPHRGQARLRQVHPGRRAGQGREHDPRLPDPAEPRLPGRGGGERRRRAPPPRGRGAADREPRRRSPPSTSSPPRATPSTASSSPRSSRARRWLPGGGAEPDVRRARSRTSWRRRWRCRAS